MDIKNVYCIINLNQYTKEEIIEDIKAEEYKHNFIFGNTMKLTIDDKARLLSNCTEVWLFGDCKNTRDYALAFVSGCDCWQMK